MNELVFLTIFTFYFAFFFAVSGGAEGQLLKHKLRGFRGSLEDKGRKKLMAFVDVVAVVSLTALSCHVLNFHNIQIVILSLLSLSIRWIMRDGIQNLETRKHFFYSGSVSFLDKTFLSNNHTNAIIKISTFTAFVLLYFIV